MGVGIQINTQVIQYFLGFLMHPLIIDKKSLFVGSSNKNVVRHTQMPAHVQLLQDNADSQVMGLCHGVDHHLLALNVDVPLICPVHP